MDRARGGHAQEGEEVRGRIAHHGGGAESGELDWSGAPAYGTRVYQRHQRAHEPSAKHGQRESDEGGRRRSRGLGGLGGISGLDRLCGA